MFEFVKLSHCEKENLVRMINLTKQEILSHLFLLYNYLLLFPPKSLNFGPTLSLSTKYEVK